MATVPTTHTFIDGIATSSEANSFIRDPIAFLLAPPIAELRQTVAQSIPNNTVTAVTFDVEDLDSAGGHSTSSNTSRYTAVYAGWYEVGGGVSFATNVTGFRASQIYVNGSATNGSAVYIMPSTGGVATVMAVRPKKVYLNVGDYVEVMAYQNSGGALNTSVTATEQSTMTVAWKSN